jgi:DegV family protein with EDD domain
MDEIADKLNIIVDNQKAYLTVDTLAYLQKGGRIGKAGAFAGTLLNIKPIISLADGELHPVEKVRGRKKVIARLVEIYNGEIGAEKEKYNALLLHSRCAEEAMTVQEELAGLGYSFDCPPVEIGPVVGAHIGPTVIGLAYMLKHEFA